MTTTTCCTKALDYIQWRLPDNFCGPEREGWALPLFCQCGDVAWENVAFCPFCGTMLLNETAQEIQNELDRQMPANVDFYFVDHKMIFPENNGVIEVEELKVNFNGGLEPIGSKSK